MSYSDRTAVILALLLVASHAQATDGPASGPLRVSKENPRYFADGDGKVVYLTGSHTWGNLCDAPPSKGRAFDYPAYLDFLKRYNHNFIRLWAPGGLGRAPIPYARTGPGTARDGGLKADLDRFDPAFFDRLRSRVATAQGRGVYVGIMLFGPDAAKREDWNLLLFNPANNVQGIDADTNQDGSGAEAFDLSIPKITPYQEAFVRKVVDTVNGLDNVLYEIGNEGDLSSVSWQYHMIRFIKSYQAVKPKQHPVGMTAMIEWVKGTKRTDDRALFDSPADWISPAASSYKDNPPAADGRKVIIADVDHIWPRAPQRGWIWECFLRGMHPIHMDCYDYDGPELKRPIPTTEEEAMRKAMGYTLVWADRMNLAAMTPRNDLASTGYCLANPGKEYLVYLPDGGEATVDLSAAPGPFVVEWFNPESGAATAGGITSGGTKGRWRAPFPGTAVLYLKTPTA